MLKVLSQQEIEAFWRNGLHFPVPVMSAGEARAFREKLEAHERVIGAPLQSNMRHKGHLLFTWANDLVRHPIILDAVEDLIGPNILCWTTNFFIKEPRTPEF